MTIFEKLAPGVPPPEGKNFKEPLTKEETALHVRACTFINAALQRHGIGLAPTETLYVGAEVADFVISEQQFAADDAKAAASKAPVASVGKVN